MIRVAFDFRWASFVAFHQQADGIGTKRHRRGIKLRLAEGHSIGLLHIRYDDLLRRPPATGKTGKRQRSRHQLQEIAAVDGVVPSRRRLEGKCTMQYCLELRITGEFLEPA